MKVSQYYRNTEDVPIEATYHFPIDEAASICGFRAEYEDGTIVKGIIKEKNKAREEYKKAIGQGKQANLLETIRRDVFTLNVGNLAAGGFVKITIDYLTTLKYQDGAASFILPTFIAPRYTPLSGGNLTDIEAQAVAPPPSSPFAVCDLNFNVKFQCHGNIQSITCPSHNNLPESAFTCQFQGKLGSVRLNNISMDKDIVLLLKEEKGSHFRACVEVDEKGSVAGFVTLLPQVEFKDMARDFVFVVDRSGSMGQKIKQVGEALALFIRALPVSCTFNVVGFGSSFAPLFPTSKPYTEESLEEAAQYAANLSANMGGTELKAPLEYVFG